MLFACHTYVRLYVLYMFVQVEGESICSAGATEVLRYHM